MGRVINPDSAGKERGQLQRAILLAVGELVRQQEPNALAHDLAAFIALGLERIDETIDASVEAWEKRGYWVKADRFRMDWSWAGRLGTGMRRAVMAEDWPQVAQLAVEVAGKLSRVKLPQRNRMGEPWQGAWNEMIKDSSKQVI